MPNNEQTVTHETVYAVFTAEINQQTSESLIQALSNLAQQNVKLVYLAFASQGGGVSQGIALYNFIRSLPYQVIMHNIGNVDSIGNAVFLAADERYACPHATFMFHGVGFDKPAARFERKDLQAMLDTINADELKIAGIIQERTGIDQDTVEQFFVTQQTNTAEFARERGIVKDIREFQLPAGVPVLSFVFQR